MKILFAYLPKYKFLFTPLILIFLIVGCKEAIVDPTQEINTDRDAMLKIAEEDPALQSFEFNYNEDGDMEFGINKTQGDIYPLRIGHRVRLVNRDFDVNIEDDTAYAKLTQTFEGILFIAAAYDPGSTRPDTLIRKPFISVITRNLIFIKTDNSPRPINNWKLAAISLPEGGVISPNIDITKLTVYTPSGDSIVITSPNDFYLSRRPGRWKDIPPFRPNQNILIQVEIFSAYNEEDFVTVTYGANRAGMNKFKKRFDLVSSVPVPGGYERTYEASFRPYILTGFFHAVVNAFPQNVIFDDSTPVENEVWGLPYFVRNN